MKYRNSDVCMMMIAYEDGTLGEEGTIKLFQHLIDTGLAWQLQGHYGRTAMRLIESGECHPAQTGDNDGAQGARKEQGK